MRHLRNHAAAAAAAICLGLAALSAAAEPAQTLAPLADKKPAPDVALDIVDAGKLRLADLHGKVLVVNFWATWCPPCRREMPSLERLKGLMHGKALEIIAINAGEGEDEIAEFRQALKPPLTFKLALDRDAIAMKAFAVSALPTTYVIDRAGRIAYRAVGRRNFDDPAIVKTLKALAAD